MKFKICLTVFIFAVIANANSGGGEAAKKEEAAPAGKPWIDTQNQVSSLRTKTKQLTDRLHGLIEEKKKTDSREKRSEIDKEMDQVYVQLRQANADLRRQEQIFKYRFPERAAKEGERSYNTQETPSLEKIEEQVGIEGKLQRNLYRMRGQYGEPKKPAAALKSQPTATPTPPPAKEPDIRHEDSPILKK